MRNSRPKKRGRPAKAATSESRYTYTSKVNRFEDEEDEESNHSSSTTNTSTSKYQTRASRKPSYRIGITIERKKSRRGRRKDAESEEDDYIVDDEYEEPAHHPNSEEESQNSDDDNSAEDDELVEEDEEEVEESEEDEAVSKKRLRPVREAPAALFLDDAEVPELTLPASSEDLLISGKELMRALSIYEILRHFQNTLRLTPFRFEDFCIALLIDEQTYLLSEIHIQLLKALIREDDLVGTQHGPQDLRDSISIYLFLCDHLTWPEVMRIYMSSDLKKNSRIITEYLRADYPFSSLHNKLALLEHFCDEFLNSQSSREVLNNEGIIKHEDNCRVCHRPGDLLCCETCPAVFHLHCLDPPLKQVPTEEWICPICKLNSVTGVTDCMSEYEKNGVLSRQEPLGWDRHGRSYWFLCRRLIVEDNKEESKVAYYSTRLQFDELLNSLDEDNYEKDLCKALEEMKEEIYRQMAITEKLTKTAKGSRKSYLEVVNEELFIKRSARLKMECEQNGDEPSAANSANEEKYAELESKLAVDEDDLRGGGVQTRLKTGTLQPKSITLDPFKNRVNVYNSINTFREEETVIIVQEESGTLTRTPRKALPANFNQINLFKLGMEGNYRQYQNIYVVNQYALSKFQQADDRDKKRHLSHKFSLTQASELKWASYTQINTALMTTTMHGTKSMLINILRQALLYLETQFSQTFMHPNWQVHRVNWIKAVSMCSEAKEFALALHILESSMKPVLFNSAWHETLGFCVLQRSTQLERDELKKKDKKDRRDQNETATIDSEATASRYYSAGIGIKLVFGKLKHQIWKQKGEEYRLSGIGGWHWLSSTRTRPEVSEAPTVEREWEPPEMNSADSALIDITKDLQQKELPSRKAYPKMYKSCKLDTLLKSRIDMHNLAEKKKRQASLEKDGKSGGAFTGYRCYSPCCDPSTSAEARCCCYSPLCCFDSQKEKLAEESESFGDTTEHVDLMQVTLVDGVQAFVKKLIPFNAKGQLPPSSRFSTGQYKNILILPTYEMRKLGRNGGLREVTGFNYNCKINNSVWPYGLTPRPYFRTIWLLRTHYLNNLHSAALQLRVFWASIRWDDLATKPPPSGTNTITTESEVQTIEILKRRDLPPFGLRSEYLTRKIIVPIDLPVKQREVSTPIRSGLRERRRPESPQVKGPRMEELWINEEDIELWEIRQFGEKAEKQQQLAKQRAAQEEKQKQLELLRKKNEDQRRLNNEQSAKVVNGSININPSKSITSRLTSIFQNRVGNKIITSPIAVSSSSINTITSGANVATTFATIRTANGTFKIPVQSKNTATQQLILRPGTQIIAANSSQSGIINNATTTTRPATTTYIVRSPNIPSNRPIIISNSALNGPIVRPINNIQTNIKQAIPLITPNTPQKISTGTTVNAILTTTQTKSIAASISQTTATSSTTSNVVISTSGLNTTTATKNIQCVQVKTNDGRTHLLPISSFAGASGQTLQIAVNSNSATPLRLITKPADSAALKDVQGKPILVAGSNSILPQNTFILSNVSQSQKLVLQPSSSVTTVSTATTSKANATTTASKGANGKPVVSATTITTTTAPLLSPPKTATAEDKEFVLTAEVTQEIVRKALMDASLPPETSQKLMAYQRHHQEMLDSTCSSTVSPMPAIHQTLKSPLKTYSFATPTHTNSTNSNSRVSSRSSRVSRSSRYDSEDFITDFHKVDRSQHRSDEDEVTRTCRGVLKYLVDKIDKEEKRAKQKEVTEERKQKKAAQQKQKFRQNHIEILRRSIIRRKAKLNITIKSRIEKSLNLKLSKVRPLLPPTPKPAVSVAAATAAAAAKNVIAPINNNINSIKRKLEEEQVIAPSPGRTNDINATKANLNSFTTPVNTTTKNKRARVTITPSLGNNNIDSAASAALPRKAQPKISPKSSKGQELYCFCKKPYDNTFMICCDRCQDWFHGRCVGITSAEADSIAEYFCPQCEGDNSINNRNIRPLNEEDYAALLTLLKAVQSHKNAWPFLKAVDKKAVPDYYIIIKEPMDLKKIEGRLNGRKYQKLAEFIYDMSKMFDNCRLYNARTSQYYHCAETLEGFFLSKVKAFREQGS